MASTTTSAANAIRVHHVPSTKVRPILPPTTTTFSFGVPSFEITTTRALENDTDFATLGIVVTDSSGNQLGMYGPTTVSTGDVGNGSHWLGMLVSGIDVPEGATMAVSFTIMNKGSSQLKDEIAHDLDMVCEGILGALAGGQLAGLSHGGGDGSEPSQDAIPLWEVAVFTVLTIGVKEALDALLADCDGWVVTDVIKFSRGDLDNSTGNAIWNWSTGYPGTESNVGCGASSHYIVNYEAAASPPAVKVPDLLSIDPGKVANALSDVGLVGHETSSSKGNVDVPQVVTQSPLPGWLALTGTTVDYSVQVPEGGHHQAP